MAEDLKEFWWVACRVPGGEGFGVDRWELVVGVGVAIRDAFSGVSYGPN
jgi:hypothetical protein